MKYSFMTFSTPELPVADIIRLARDMGYDGVEPRIQAKHAHGIDFDTPAADRAAIREQFEDGGIDICCLATSCQYANTDALAEHVENTKKAIDLAGDMGAPALRVFGGMLSEGLSREDAIDQVAGALASVADQAQGAGVMICMETHDAWTDPAHVAAIMTKVGHPNIAVNWDIMHPVRQSKKTIDEAFETLKPWIRHCHVHDGTTDVDKLTMLPIGEGGIDHYRAMERLVELNYQGYISGEWIGWEPYETHLPRELATMKAYEAKITG